MYSYELYAIEGSQTAVYNDDGFATASEAIKAAREKMTNIVHEYRYGVTLEVYRDADKIRSYKVLIYDE